MYTKQSAYVLALFLGTASTVSITENFATGMNGDEDLGEDITMKGDKFHFNQYLMMDAEPAANATAPAAANATAAPAGVSAATPAAKYPAPEKVHTLDPKIAKAHTTFYDKQQTLLQMDPNVRTAFYAQYDQQNGLWRTSDELVALHDNGEQGDTVPQVQKSLEDQWAKEARVAKVANVPMIHPYNYDPWVYKFSRDVMGPHSQHIDDDPEDSRPKSKEELAGTPDAMAKKEAAEAEEKKMKDAGQAMKDGAEKEPSKADEAKKDAEALEGAMKKADLADAVAKVEKKEEKKEEKKAELLMTATNVPNRFYNAQDGLWMFDTTLLAAAPEEKKEAEAPKAAAPVEEPYGDAEKVANLMPKRYQLGANTNQVNGVNVRRTTFYGQQQPEYLQIQGEPENSVQSTQFAEFGQAEKVQNLMPRRYERSANSNKVDGVRVSRTTYYAQLEDDVAAPTGTPTEQVAILEPVAYKHAADTNLPFTRTTFY